MKKLIEAVINAGLDGMLVTSDVNRRYVTEMNSSAGIVLALKDKTYLIIDGRYIEAARKNARVDEVVLLDASSKYTDIINRITAEHGVKILGFEDMSMTYDLYVDYSEKLGAKLERASKIINSLRMIKTEEEIENITSAQRIAEKAFDHILGFIKSDVTEREIALELDYFMLKNGAEGLAFDTICVSGERSSMPHGTPTDKKIAAGEFVTMDYGCKKSGYCSDMTRTVAVGSVSDEMKRVYETVLSAQNAAIDFIKAGVSGKEADKIARDIINAAGYEGAFGHALGHSLGLEIHEEPRFSPVCDTAVSVNTVMTVEPGIYLEGKFGVRIEDMVVLKQDKAVNLTNCPKELLTL